jgi:hypothetical protein
VILLSNKTVKNRTKGGWGSSGDKKKVWEKNEQN